ncbi:receptor-type tyrosine-protein phosphatase C isoform X2 [Engraulis encrasicolus]|uniref:receptor-type tyrosine-protein phosphatase C isoform X2 n=1 Tax=Engraulis encrasicolus TaxID=184585 RepID=UPI002FD597EE
MPVIEVNVAVSEVSKSSTSITLDIKTPSSCQQFGIGFTSNTTCTKKHNSNIEVYSRSNTVSGMEPFTAYTCTVTPQFKFNDTAEVQTLQKSVDIDFTTKTDKPMFPKHSDHTVYSVDAPQNNDLHFKCVTPKWNGPSGHFEATLNPGKKEAKKSKGQPCDFLFDGLSYSTVYEISIVAVNGQGDKSMPQTHKASTSYNDKALIGVLAFLIILTSIALLFVLYKIYVLQKQRNNDHPDEVIPLAPNPLMTVEPIAAETLLDVYKKKIADEGRLFLAEFQSVPRIFSNFTVKVAKNPENQAKNRYVDILPYDYNRVQLTSNGGEPGADYINASFIEGFKEQKKYIAAQGPKEETMADFWRMVWEQKSSIIVMVTRCEEGNRSKCAQYWPSMDRETEIYGDFVLKIKKEDTCPDYIIRHLTIINRKDKAEREVTHIQFTSWPDHGVPSEPHLLLKLRRRVNSFSNLFSGPIVVHCSAGVGRTGTYIGIDAMLESLDSEGVMDIYGYVVKMRRQRCLMVQVEAQYILIHQALIEFNQFGDTEISLAELHSCLSGLQHRDSTSEPTMMEVEFQRLPKYRNWRTFNTAVSEENKKKNRYSTAIPYDFNRVLVKLEEEKSNDDEDDDDDDDDDYSSDDDDEEDSTQYINATYIDGYWSPRSLIAAQGPLEDTVPEFWQMVYQKRVKNIVMLSQCTEGNEELCAEYWSKEKKSYKDISVEETACISSAAYTKRTLQLQHAKRKDSRQVQQYHFQGWPEKSVKKTEETDDKKEEEKRDGLPDHPQELVELVRSIKKTIGNTRAERSTPVLVHCHDGTSRTGVFCALWNIVDSATTENLVDIFQVCKSLRKERQGMIADYEQYQFLYKAVEGAFPAQNGEVKQTPAPAPAADSLQIISEVPASATTDNHQVEPKDAATAAEPKEDTQKEKKEEKEADGAIETISLLPEGGASEASEQSGSTDFLDSGSSANGPTITVEV